MKSTAVCIFLLALISASVAEIEPIFPLLPDAQTGTVSQPIIPSGSHSAGLAPTGNITGSILPTEVFYYRVEAYDDVQPEDYLVIQLTMTPSIPSDPGMAWVVNSDNDNLEQYLQSGAVCDTLFGLPSPTNHNVSCGLNPNGQDWSSISGTPLSYYCDIQLTCQFTNGTYYIGIAGGKNGAVYFRFNVFRGTRNVTALNTRGSALPVFNAQRPTVSPNAEEANALIPLQYRYYEIDVNDFFENSYLVVNISRVEPFFTSYPVLRLHYGELPQGILDTGVVETTDDNLDDDDDNVCYYQHCVDMANAPQPYYSNPTGAVPRIPCQCQPVVQSYGSSFQLTCNVTVDPCFMKTGKWYASVQLPPRAKPSLANDLSGRLNYTIFAVLNYPTIAVLRNNITAKGAVEPEQATHYKIAIAQSDLPDGVGNYHLLVQVSNIRGATLDIWVHQGLGGNAQVAGGPEACAPANVTCRSCDACNLVIEKCYFVPGTWYISLNIPYDSANNRFLVEDPSRLPATFTLRTTWSKDPAPTTLLAGIPVHKYIGESLYDFYVVDIPPTIDTWLFVELYVQANDTEVILSMLHGDIPGGECYARPDFYCLTGNPSAQTISTGPPQDLVNAVVARESCTFMIQTCQLEAGPLYLSVYGHHIGYTPYGDTTFYQIPVQYTLWVDFDVATPVVSGVSYSETVFEKQYNHYYIRADNVDQGSWLSVEVTNIQHGIPPTVETFVNYGFLAGNCPCYDHLYNCSGALYPRCGEPIPYGTIFPPGPVDADVVNFVPEPDIINTCCTIVVPPCAFRSGVWYIGVLGINENLVEYTTPIGYTLTVTVHPPPKVYPLVLGQPAIASVPQWNKTLQYVHYKLGARPIPNHDLVFRLTYVQNCEYRGKHDNLRDTLRMYVSRNNLATEDCFRWHCDADVLSSSYCDVVVQQCDWIEEDSELLVKYYDGSGESDYLFVSIQGDYDAVFPGRYTLEASVVPVQEHQLKDGVSVYGKVGNQLYQHYVFVVNPDGTFDLNIDLYTNSDQDRVTVFLNVDSLAGAAPCYTHLPGYVCTDVSCSWQISSSELVIAPYYISVFGGTFFDDHQFYAIPVEYTLTAYTAPIQVTLVDAAPYTASTWVNQIHHYSYKVSEVNPGDFLLFEVDNVRHGHVRAFALLVSDDDEGTVAAPCPLGKYDVFCDARGSDCDQDLDSNDPNWCEIRVAPCKLRTGTYYFSVLGVSYNDADRTLQPPNVYTTPIGYTIEANLIQGVVVEPDVERDAQLANVLSSQAVYNDRYIHYSFDTTDDQGFQVIVQISNIQNGALYVYYNNGKVSDEDSSCQLARICSTNGALTPGASCNWQLPYCLTNTADTHYVSVEGKTGLDATVFDILIYLERPLAVAANPNFNPFNLTGTVNPALEVNVTHDYTDQPNGWSQFIRLVDVSLTDRVLAGDILEVFFYRVQNNVGDLLTFDAYLWPGKPSGPRECCGNNASPDQEGACQAYPCLKHVPTTTSTDNFYDARYSSTCNSGVVGTGANPANPFPGPFPCTLTVWSCDLDHFQPSSEPIDWWLTVIPSVGAVRYNPPNPTLPGLSYSVAWRVRNVRTFNGTAATTGDLTPYLNEVSFPSNITNYGYTPQFSVQGYQNWASFKVDLEVDDQNDVRKKLIIQTRFDNTVPASVYILPEKNANPLHCNTYYCAKAGVTNNTLCNTSQRYVNSSCCARTNSYYISVRNQDSSFSGNNPTPALFSFRVTSLQETPGVDDSEPVYDIPDSPTYVTPFVSASNATVVGENYDHYKLKVSESDIANQQSLSIFLTQTNGTSGLSLYFRKGYEAGAYSVSNEDYWNEAEGCYSYQYTCNTQGSLQCCSIQVPHCQLTAGDWYVGVYNPTVDFSVITPVSYGLTVYFDPAPANLTVGVAYTNNGTISANATLNRCGSFYAQHVVVVEDDDLQFENRDEINGYYTRFLRISVFGISGNPADLFVNYGDVAGDSGNSWCLDNFASQLSCSNALPGGCYVDVQPCSDPATPTTIPKLITGPYYVGLRIQGGAPTGYSIRVDVIKQTYTVLVPQVYSHWRGDVGKQNLIFSATPSAPLQTNYYYAIDTQTALNDEDDDLSGDHYMLGMLTVNTPSAVPNVILEVWRDDCTRWTCSVTSDRGTCYIDALELAPCSVKGGRYYFNIQNPNSLAFTFQWFINTTHTETLCSSGRVLAENVYSFEYQEFVYRPVYMPASTIAINIVSSAGIVEAWIQKGGYAGPGPDATNIHTSCNIDYCRTQADGGVSVFGLPSFSCQLFLDTCNVDHNVPYYIAIRGDTQVFKPASPGTPVTNLTNIAIPYTIQAVRTQVYLTDLSFFDTPTIVSYVKPWNTAPRQYELDVETLLAGSVLRFSMQVPIQAYASGKVATLYVSRNRTVGYVQNQCPNEVGGVSTTCSTTINDATSAGRTCIIQLGPCESQPGIYYIWADAPRGTEILVDKWEQPTPRLELGDHIYATISGDSILGNVWNPPLRLPVQAYKVPIDATQRNFNFKALLYGLTYSDSAYLSINDGMFPTLSQWNNPANALCEANFWTCQAAPATSTHNCTVYVPRCALGFNTEPIKKEECAVQQVNCDNNCAFKCGQHPPQYLWVTVVGSPNGQTCELHSIPYNLVVTTEWDPINIGIQQKRCETVDVEDYDYFRLFPLKSPSPQNYILNINIRNVALPGQVQAVIQDGFLPAVGPTGTVAPFDPECNLASGTTVAELNGAYGSTTIEWVCGFGKTADLDAEFNDGSSTSSDDEGLWVGVYGLQAASGASIDYSINVEAVPIQLRELTGNSRLYVDDDDDDVCEHKRDFFVYNSKGAAKDPESAFFEVSVKSPGDFTVYVNQGGLAWTSCSNTDWGTVVDDPTDDDEENELLLHDFCNFADGNIYYITVTAATNYSIKARVESTTPKLSLDDSFADTINPGAYQTYVLTVPDKAVGDTSRLVVAVEDVYFGSVKAWIRRDHIGGPFHYVNSGEEGCSILQYNQPNPSYYVTATFPPSSSVIAGQNEGYSSLLVDTCCLSSGTYYITVYGTRPGDGRSSRNCRATRFTLTPRIYDLNLEPAIVELTSGDPKVNVAIDLYNVARQNNFAQLPRFHYYAYTAEQGANSFAQVRLANVRGGYLALYAKIDHLATFTNAFWDNEVTAVNNAYNQLIFTGSRPFDAQGYESFNPLGASCPGCADQCCRTGHTTAQGTPQEEAEPFTSYTSCSIWIDQCTWNGNGRGFFAVAPLTQFYEDHSILYNLNFEEKRGFQALGKKEQEHTLTNNNWQYQFYGFAQATPASVVVSISVTAGEGVLVDLYNAPCPSCASWHKQIWCSAQFAADPWVCEIEVPQRAEHPGDLNFYLSVFGKNAKYSIRYTSGLENCHKFSGSGKSEGLDFCRGLPYNTWIWDDYSHLDNEARSLFIELYEQFRVQPCWSGVTPECNNTLTRFACYETFRRCDQQGFQVGTCQKACDAVVYQCVNYFESVDLEAYNCTSSRYVPDHSTCTGDQENDPSYDFPDPDQILFHAGVKVSAGSSVYQGFSLTFAMASLFVVVSLLFGWNN